MFYINFITGKGKIKKILTNDRLSDWRKYEVVTRVAAEHLLMTQIETKTWNLLLSVWIFFFFAYQVCFRPAIE